MRRLPNGVGKRAAEEDQHPQDQAGTEYKRRKKDDVPGEIRGGNRLHYDEKCA